MSTEANAGVRLVVDQSKFKLEKKYLNKIADEYEVCSMTMNRWLKKHNLVVERGYISGTKQIEIYNKLGWPERYLQLSAA